ncbi:hypothetical protein KBZ19_12610 [Synechococcus sp. L2F]|uniref:hypothetical protein n=1 Tax=Synechococcus sp. L2F TaxID=2823739 RepID=UPI0020CEF4A0|nr:hypothetical protein [Synechococcus sp. L2F]MCP9829327.1 hypothetical protein [Synechococcus sp. L2F]
MPEDRAEGELWIRSHFGEPCESTRGSALERLRLDIDYLEAAGPSSTDPGSYLPWSSQDGENEQQAQAERCWNGLRAMASLQRLKSRDCPELVSEELWPAHLLVHDSA